jgi:hypothetical protein
VITMASDTKTAANGRPVEYTAEIGMTICDRIVEGESLRTIDADPGMPDKATVLDWLARHKEFRDAYTSAREFQEDGFLEEIIAIARDCSGDRVEKVRANGRVVMVADPKHLARCRLRIDVRCWVADRMWPTKQEKPQTDVRRGRGPEKSG